MALILIVDDEPPIRKIVKEILEDAGHQCLLAKGADEADATMEKKSVDLALVDLVLPDRSGIQLIESIHETHPLLPIVAMSGYISVESQSITETLRSLGVRQMVQKPFEREQLVGTIQEALDGRSGGGLP